MERQPWGYVGPQLYFNYIPKIGNFGDIMVLVRSQSPLQLPQAKACVSRNCYTNARIKFIFDTAIDDLEWKNPVDFGEYRKTKMAAILWKYDGKACALHNLIKNALNWILFCST